MMAASPPRVDTPATWARRRSEADVAAAIVANLAALLAPPPVSAPLLGAHALTSALPAMPSFGLQAHRAKRENAVFELKCALLPCLDAFRDDAGDDSVLFAPVARRVIADVTLDTPVETVSVYHAVLELLSAAATPEEEIGA